MPELPEVETVRRQLAGVLVRSRFVAVRKTEPAMLRDCTNRQVGKLLPGRRVESVDRVGKFLVLNLDEATFLTVHLGMTGKLLLAHEAVAKATPHTRFLFTLASPDESRLELEFRDMRKFGRLHLTTGAPAPRLESLGPDAWVGDWDAAYLARSLRGRTSPVKAFLLDQSRLAGVGNIYADEILWWSRLSPLRPCGSLSVREVAVLGKEIRRVLGEGVRLLGCSISDFVDTGGTQGSFQNWLRAYGRQGQSCTRCGRVLARAVVAGRGTAYCPGCQR